MKGSEDASPHSPSLSDYGEDHSCDTAVTENDVSPSCLNPLLAKDERDQIPQRSPQGAAKDQQEEETSQGDVFDYSCLPPELVAHLTSFIEDGTTFLSIAFTCRSWMLALERILRTSRVYRQERYSFAISLPVGGFSTETFFSPSPESVRGKREVGRQRRDPSLFAPSNFFWSARLRNKEAGSVSPPSCVEKKRITRHGNECAEEGATPASSCSPPVFSSSPPLICSPSAFGAGQPGLLSSDGLSFSKNLIAETSYSFPIVVSSSSSCDLSLEAGGSASISEEEKEEQREREEEEEEEERKGESGDTEEKRDWTKRRYRRADADLFFLRRCASNSHLFLQCFTNLWALRVNILSVTPSFVDLISSSCPCLMDISLHTRNRLTANLVLSLCRKLPRLHILELCTPKTGCVKDAKKVASSLSLHGRPRSSQGRKRECRQVGEDAVAEEGRGRRNQRLRAGEDLKEDVPRQNTQEENAAATGGTGQAAPVTAVQEEEKDRKTGWVTKSPSDKGRDRAKMKEMKANDGREGLLDSYSLGEGEAFVLTRRGMFHGCHCCRRILHRVWRGEDKKGKKKVRGEEEPDADRENCFQQDDNLLPERRAQRRSPDHPCDCAAVRDTPVKLASERPGSLSNSLSSRSSSHSSREGRRICRNDRGVFSGGPLAYPSLCGQAERKKKQLGSSDIRSYLSLWTEVIDLSALITVPMNA